MLLFLLSTTVVILLASPEVVRSDFTPGCSFVGGQCQYSVTLGHAGQCDSSVAGHSGSGTRTGDAQCCETVQAALTSVKSDLDLLQSQVKGLINDLTRERDELTHAQTTLNQTEAERDALLVTLRQKEAELNNTQTELANLIHRTGNEITALRSELVNMTSQVDTCRAALGLPTVETKVLARTNQIYCDFSSLNQSPCKWTVSNTQFRLMTHSSSSAAGPASDHSQGSVSGQYLSLDAHRVAEYGSSGEEHAYTAVSQAFEPANSYCFYFYYSMLGTEVRDLEVTVKVGSGLSYPVWSASGPQGSEWSLGQFQLDSEYTENPFSIEFTAKTKAFTRFDVYYYDEADIGIDDLYAYNTTCDQVPQCSPKAAYRNTNGNTTSCYTFHVGALSWKDAYYTCRKEGPWSSLVSVESQLEQDYLAGVIQADPALSSAGQYGFYTSGNDLKVEHTFVWTDTGSSRRVSDLYENWHTNQPNNVGGVQDCLLLEYSSENYTWGDVDCKSAHPFICESFYTN